MELKNQKLSTYDDLLSSNIDTTTKLVVLTGATKVNANLPVTSFIEDSLTSNSVVKPLSAKQGKALQDTKAPTASPKFTGTVEGVTKAMVGLSNVDNTSDAGKPISTAQANAIDAKSPKINPEFTGYLKLIGDTDGNNGILLTDDQSAINYDPLGKILKIGQRGDGMTIEIASNKINLKTKPFGTIVNLPVFADNAAALTGTLVDGDLYRTSTGVVMITYAV